jgi:hypothetical protein
MKAFAKVVAYQRHVINLAQKHDCLLGPIGNADEIPVLFDMLINTGIDTKGEKSVLA